MKALVTGGAGFVGSNLIKKLLDKGYEVISLDNYSTGTFDNHVEGCNYQYADLGKEYVPERWFEGVDVVFHLAARARIQPSWNKAVDYFRSNAMATMNVADICHKNNIFMVYAGSSSHHSGKFKNPYTFSKDVGEEIIWMYSNTLQGFKASIARFYNVYGPNQIEGGEFSTLIGRWIDLYKKGEKFVIYGDGKKTRSFTHVDDVVEGLIGIYEHNSIGEIYELGSPKSYSVNEIAKAFWGKEWKSRVRYEESKIGEAQDTKVDKIEIDKAKIKIGLEIRNDVLDYIYSFKEAMEVIDRLDRLGKKMFNGMEERLTENEKKVLNDMYGTKDVDNDIDKVYQGIVQKELIDITTIEDNSPRFKEIYRESPTLIDRYVKEVAEEARITTGSYRNYGKYDSKDKNVSSPTIDEFTDKIRKMREGDGDPFIFWR